MSRSFSNYHAEHVSPCRVPASGIDQEAIHQIRQQGRIERAKVVRQGFAALKRMATRFTSARASHEPSNQRRAGIWSPRS